MSPLRRVILVTLLPLAWLAAPSLAPAQVSAQDNGAGGRHGGTPVYRCGPGQYSSEPCPGGVKLDTPAPPTAEQQRLAREAAARDAQLARQLADERRQRERDNASRPALGNVAPKPAAAASAAPTPAMAASQPPPKKDAGKKKAAARKALAKAQEAAAPVKSPGKSATKGRTGKSSKHKSQPKD